MESYTIPELGREDVNSIRPLQLLHHAAITDPAAVGALLCKIDRYAGRALTRLALKLSPLVFVRPHNLRKARWENVDLETFVWSVRAASILGGLHHEYTLVPTGA